MDLPALDGALMANALHFSDRQEATLRRVVKVLRAGGRPSRYHRRMYAAVARKE